MQWMNVGWTLDDQRKKKVTQHGTQQHTRQHTHHRDNEYDDNQCQGSEKKKKANNTGCSRAVTHHSTNPARPRLT